MSFLLQYYDATYYAESASGAGKSVYVKRNIEMIDKSEYCLIYYDKEYLPPKRKKHSQALVSYQPKSGTRIAYEYAAAKGKRIINIYEEIF